LSTQLNDSGVTFADGTVLPSAASQIKYNYDTIDTPMTIPAGQNAHSVGAITINAAVTINGRWVIS